MRQLRCYRLCKDRDKNPENPNSFRARFLLRIMRVETGEKVRKADSSRRCVVRACGAMCAPAAGLLGVQVEFWWGIVKR